MRTPLVDKTRADSTVTPDENPLLNQSTEEDYVEISTKVKVSEMAPNVFAYLRSLDGIDRAKIEKSLDPKNNV